MADTTPNLTLPYIMAAQAQKHVTHNEAIRALDCVVQLAVEDRDATTPPASPNEGQRFIVAAGAAGVWAGHAEEVAAWQDGAWAFYPPTTGWVAWVADEAALVAWTGSAWEIAGGGSGSINPAPLVGVVATADATNRLAVSSPASLFTHAGAGHQLKINKNAPGDTGSVLFQTGFSGRAEMGLAGDDNYHFKVSPDGSTWHEAIVIDGADGTVTFPSSTISAGVAVDDEGNPVVATAARLNFAGSGVVVTAGANGSAVVTIPGAGGTGNVPAGGSTGQVLTKVSAVDNDTAWSSPAAGGVTSINGQSGAVVLGTSETLDVVRIEGSMLAAIVDADDHALLAFEADGALQVPALTTSLVTSDALALAGTTTQEVFGLGFAIVHANERVAFYLREDGTGDFPGHPLPGTFVVEGVAAAARPENDAVDFNVHLNSGQSLAVTGASGAIVDANEYSLNGGQSALVPLTNTAQYGLGLVLQQQLKYALKGDPSIGHLPSPGFHDDFAQVFQTNAFSGTTIGQLSPGASPDRFAINISAVQAVSTIAQAAGKAAQVGFVSLFHGESDVSNAGYKAAMIALKDAYNAQVAAVTLQPNRLPMLIYQVAGSNSGGIPIVGKAQWEAWQDDPEIVLVGPLYPYKYTDALHVDPNGIKHFGQLAGKVAYLASFMGATWKPLHPLSARARPGNQITIKFHVPQPPIVIDTTTVPPATNLGFRVFDVSGEVPVTAVGAINGDTMRLVLGRALGANATIEYAWRDHPVDGGAGNFDGNGTHAIRGNVRDSDASAAVYGAGFPLWNWLVRFSISITA